MDISIIGTFVTLVTALITILAWIWERIKNNKIKAESRELLGIWYSYNLTIRDRKTVLTGYKWIVHTSKFLGCFWVIFGI